MVSSFFLPENLDDLPINTTIHFRFCNRKIPEDSTNESGSIKTANAPARNNATIKFYTDSCTLATKNQAF
jgi:hypothetical protein